jgi:hypothetical protein
MAGSTGDPHAVEAVTACHSATVEICAQLGWLRHYLHGLDVERLGISHARYQALMSCYDIYVRMVDDVLTDVASALQDRAAAVPDREGSDTEPAQSVY